MNGVKLLAVLGVFTIVVGLCVSAWGGRRTGYPDPTDAEKWGAAIALTGVCAFVTAFFVMIAPYFIEWLMK